MANQGWRNGGSSECRWSRGALTAGVVMFAGKSDEMNSSTGSIRLRWMLLVTMVTNSVIHLSVTTHLCFGSVPQLVH